MEAPRYYSRLGATAASSGGNLPHWSQSCATFTTFRLNDSLPQDKLLKLDAEKQSWLSAHPQPWSKDETEEFDSLFGAKIEQWLDAGYGSCFMKDEAVRRLVESTLGHFANDRYSLYAYVVMPNHVHVLFMPNYGVDGRTVVADWKRFSARVINRALGRTGALWQKESYDHLVRDVDEFNRIRAYIRGNDRDRAYDFYNAP